MGLFDYKEKDGPGVGKNAEKAPAYVVFFKVFAERIANLVGLNLVYIFSCLPIFTIGSATAGFTYVLRNYSQRKHVDMMHDYIAKCKEHFKKGILITVLDLLIGAAIVCAVLVWSGDDLIGDGIVKYILLAVVFYFAYLYICTNFYLFPMLVSFDLPLKKVVKNSLILATSQLWRNIAMLAVNGLVFGLCIVFMPIPLPILLCLAFSFCGLFNNSIIYPVLVKHVATPVGAEPEIPDEEKIFKDPY